MHTHTHIHMHVHAQAYTHRETGIHEYEHTHRHTHARMHIPTDFSNSSFGPCTPRSHILTRADFCFSTTASTTPCRTLTVSWAVHTSLSLQEGSVGRSCYHPHPTEEETEAEFYSDPPGHRSFKISTLFPRQGWWDLLPGVSPWASALPMSVLPA